MGDHTIMITWVIKIIFVKLFCEFLPPLLNIFCLLGPHISFLCYGHLCTKFSHAIFNFLEEISSLSHSVVFLYFLALITEEDFHLSLLFFGILHSKGCIFLFLLCFLLLFFITGICKASSDNHFPFYISFSWRWS